MVLPTLHGFEHCGIGGLTIREKSDFVSLRQRAFGNRFDYGGQAFQNVRRVDRSLQSFHDSLVFLGR